MKITFGVFGINQTRSLSYRVINTEEQALKLLKKAIDNPDAFVLSIRIYRNL